MVPARPHQASAAHLVRKLLSDSSAEACRQFVADAFLMNILTRNGEERITPVILVVAHATTSTVTEKTSGDRYQEKDDSLLKDSVSADLLVLFNSKGCHWLERDYLGHKDD